MLRLFSLLVCLSAAAPAATLITAVDFSSPTIVTFPGNATFANPSAYTEAGASFRGTNPSQTVYLQNDMFNPNTARSASTSFDVIFPSSMTHFGFVGNPSAIGNPSSYDVTSVVFFSDAAMTSTTETYSTPFAVSSNNFFGLESSTAFAAVRITLTETGQQGFSPVLDDFRFENASVPEPASFGLLGLGDGALLLAWRRRASTR